MTQLKFDTLIHYICARCDNPSSLGAANLNRILWYSDVLYFAAEGRSITGETYIRRQFGPVPREILQARARLEAAGAIVVREALYGGYPQTQFIAMHAPDISCFSPDEISLVDRVVATICSGRAEPSISQLSHDAVWKSADIGEELPMSAAAFAGNFGEIDEEDMAWAQREIDRIGKAQVVA